MCGSGSRKLLNTDPIRIRINNTGQLCTDPETFRRLQDGAGGSVRPRYAKGMKIKLFHFLQNAVKKLPVGSILDSKNFTKFVLGFLTLVPYIVQYWDLGQITPVEVMQPFNKF